MDNSDEDSQQCRYEGYGDGCDGRISNELNDESVVDKFKLAVSNSPMNQKEALEEALAKSITEDDRGLPTLKSEIINSYRKNEN